MKKILLILSVCLLTSCTVQPLTTETVCTNDNLNVFISHFVYNKHNYLLFTVHTTPSIVHDPNCRECKRQRLLESETTVEK